MKLPAPVDDENVIRHRFGKNLQSAAAACSQRSFRTNLDIAPCVKQVTCGAGFPDLASPAYPVADNFSFIRFPARYFMEVISMSSRHAVTPRGLNVRRSPLSQGRFGRMFRKAKPATFGASDSDNIA